MPIPALNTASLSFRLKVLDPVVMAAEGPVVMARFREFILAYDADLSKGRQWLSVPFKAQHDWAVDLANRGSQYDAQAFWLAYAKVTSEVFFLDSNPPASGLPHPRPGAWAATSLRATPSDDDNAIYIWEYDPSNDIWIRVCYGNFDLVDPSGSGPVSPVISVGGTDVAKIGLTLTYGDADGLAP